MSERTCVICGKPFHQAVTYHGVKRIGRYVSQRQTCGQWCKNEFISRQRTRNYFEAAS